MDPLPPELPPRAPLDEPDGRILGGGGAGLGTPFAETPDATGEPHFLLKMICLCKSQDSNSERRPQI